MPYLTSIKEVESIVGKKASDVSLENNDIVCVFSGGLIPDTRMQDGNHLAGDIRFHIKRW